MWRLTVSDVCRNSPCVRQVSARGADGAAATAPAAYACVDSGVIHLRSQIRSNSSFGEAFADYTETGEKEFYYKVRSTLAGYQRMLTLILLATLNIQLLSESLAEIKIFKQVI